MLPVTVSLQLAVQHSSRIPIATKVALPGVKSRVSRKILPIWLASASFSSPRESYTNYACWNGSGPNSHLHQVFQKAVTVYQLPCSGYLIGDSVTWADLYLAEFAEIEKKVPFLYDDFPEVIVCPIFNFP